MKLAIVSPQFPFSGRVPLVPPILEYLAALTRLEDSSVDLQLIDANQTHISPEAISAPTVAISVMTATAPWAYRFADDCRKIGKRVVLGGIHPSALPEEAALHADAVVVGEAESVWGRVLSDIRRGTLESFYFGERLPLDNLPIPINCNLKGNYQFRAFFTMRGCPYRCTFCSVRKFYGDTIRYRPISSVAEEIETCAGRLWFNGDDNIWGGDLQRSINLFHALAEGSKRHWYGFGDLRSIQTEKGPKMLAAARKSGLFSVWVGWEGDEKYLGTFKAGGKQGADREAAVKQMQDAGIDVTLFVVLGGRQDSIDSFKRTLELSERLQVGIHPVLLTPLPGTELYEEYREHLLPGLGWESFTGVNAVFEHPSPGMSPLVREQEYHRLSNELFRFERIVSRIGTVSSKGFPYTHLYSFMMQIPMKHALSKAFEEWKEMCVENPMVKAPEDPPLIPYGNAPAETGPGGSLLSAGCHWLWLSCIIALKAIDAFERVWIEYSFWLNLLKILFFFTSFVLALAGLFANRRTLYNCFDRLIDWRKDGFQRRVMLLRHSFILVVYCFGWYFGYIYTFR